LHRAELSGTQTIPLELQLSSVMQAVPPLWYSILFYIKYCRHGHREKLLLDCCLLGHAATPALSEDMKNGLDEGKNHWVERNHYL